MGRMQIPINLFHFFHCFKQSRLECDDSFKGIDQAASKLLSFYIDNKDVMRRLRLYEEDS